MKNSGKLVENKDGKVGRTFDSKGLINGKVPVYFATEFKSQNGFMFPVAFAENAVICEPTTLKVFGYLD